MSLLPRFVPTSTGGPAVLDRTQGLWARFETEAASQGTARFLNQFPAMLEAYTWTDEQGDPQ